jgi:hypothetical protein
MQIIGDVPIAFRIDGKLVIFDSLDELHSEKVEMLRKGGIDRIFASPGVLIRSYHDLMAELESIKGD